MAGADGGGQQGQAHAAPAAGAAVAGIAGMGAIGSPMLGMERTASSVPSGVASLPDTLLAVTTGDVVDLGDVLVSNKHEFSYCGLQNLTDVPLRVEMSSTVRTVGFQHSNENFRSEETGVFPSPTSDKHNFNQVFNYVNLIKTMSIPPEFKANVVISYRPTIPSSAGDALDYRESGELIFHAFAEDGRSQALKVKVTCRCCKSVLELSCTELDFGVISSTPTEQNTQIQEFTFRNESVMPVSLIMRLSRVSNALECTFTDPSTDDPTISVLDTEMTLGPHDLKRIQVSVRAKPGAVGDHDMQLQIENLLDQSSRNVLILASISSANTSMKPPIDISLPGSTAYLDFGNCYAGMPHSQHMEITNQSLQTAVVTFDHHSNDHRDRVKGMLSLRLSEGQHAHQASSSPEIHDVVVKPGQTQRLEVTYTPDLSSDKRDKLSRRLFRLFIRALLIKEGEERPSEDDPKSSQYSRGISCRAMVCTSRIEVKEKEIDFGDAPIGATASCHVTIENPTQLPAELQVDYDSKIMKAVLDGNHVTIKANSAVSLAFQIVPHKVNPSFCKQVVLRNLRNPKDVNIINLSSNNIDSLASASVQYYSIIFLHNKVVKKHSAHADPTDVAPDVRGVHGQGDAPTTAADARRLTEIGRGQSRNGFSVEVAMGFPVLRAFKVKNKRSTPLTLNLAVSRPDCIQLYTATDSLPSERLLPGFTDGWLDILPERDHREEVAYVERVLELKHALHSAIHETGSIAPLSSITLPPEGEAEGETIIYVLITVPPTYDVDSVKRRGTLEERISISIDNSNDKEPSVGERIIPVVIQLGASGLELGQKNFNLGQVVVGERKCRTIQISNTSYSFPLLFAVTKDNASLDSTQLRIEGSKDQRYVGLVRPFARRPLELQFHPSMRGKFNEKLTFSNLLDPSVTKTMTIKADVSKVATFEVKPTAVDAGAVFVGDASLLPTSRQNNAVKAKVTLINTGKVKREYFIGPSPATPLNTDVVEMRPEFEVEAIKSQASSQNVEEEIEALEQKIKGLMRKKKEDKVVRARAKLNRLKAIAAGEQSAAEHDTSDVSSSEDEGLRRSDRDRRSGEERAGPNCIVTKAVPPGGTVSIGMTIHLKVGPAARIDADTPCNVDVVISEARDKESQKTVKVQFRACGNPSAFIPAGADAGEGVGLALRTDGIAPPSVRSPSPVVPGGGAMRAGAFGPPPGADDVRPPSAGHSDRQPRGRPEDASPEHRTTSPFSLPPSRRGGGADDHHHASVPGGSSGGTSAETGTLQVSTDAIDFGKVAIGGRESRTLELTAVTNTVGYVILQNKRLGGDELSKDHDAKVDIAPKNGTIPPGTTQRVTVTVTPQTTQLQKYVIEIRNLHDKTAKATKVTLTVCGTVSVPLSITPKQLNFENIYLGVEGTAQVQDRHTAVHKSTQVTLRNMSSTAQTILVTSTHPAQCAIYSSSRHEPSRDHEVKKLTLTPREIVPLHVFLYPRLSRTKARLGDSRSMKGAVVFSSESGSWRKSVPFTCVIGCVELEVSGSSVTDLGTKAYREAPGNAERRGTFTLMNRNQHLALEYRVVVSNGAILHVDSVEGVIPPKAKVVLRYTLAPPSMKFGLFQESIEIRNTTSSQMPIRRTLLLFVDPGLVKVDVVRDVSSVLDTPKGVLTLPVMPVRKSNAQATPKTANLIPGGYQDSPLGLPLGPPAVPGASTVPPATSAPGVTGAAASTREFTFAMPSSHGRVQVKLKNTANVDLYVVPKCDVHGFCDSIHYASSLFVHVGKSDRSRVPTSHSGAMKGLVWSPAGSCFLLPKYKAVLLSIEPSCVPLAVDDDAKAAMALNRRALIQCNLSFVIEKADTSGFHSNTASAKLSMLSMGYVVQMMKVNMALCRPHVVFETPTLSMGKVRNDEKIPLNIDIRNPSQVKVPVELELPPNMLWEMCPTPRVRCSYPAFVEPFQLTELAHPLPSFRPLDAIGFGHSHLSSPVKTTAGRPAFPRAHATASPLGNTPPLALPSVLMTPPKSDDRCCIALLHSPLDSTAHRTPCTTVIPAESSFVLHGLLVPPFNAKDQGKLSAQVVLRSLLDGEEQTMNIEGEIERNIWAFQLNTNSPQLMRDNEALALDSTVRVGGDGKNADVKVFLRCTESIVDSESINANITIEPDEGVQQFLSFKILFLATNLEVESGLSFTREDTYTGLRVRCAPLPGKCVSQPVAELLWKTMFEDAINRAEHAKIKNSTEIHIQNHSGDAHWASRQHTGSFDNAGSVASDDGSKAPARLNFAVVSTLLRSQGATAISTSVPLGLLCVTAPGYADYRKDIFGVLQQSPTFEAVKSLTLSRPHRTALGEESPAMCEYTATFAIAYPQAVGRDTLTVRVEAVAEYGYEITTGPEQTVAIPLAGSREVTIKARMSSSVKPEQLNDVLLVFVQDVDCPLAFQVIRGTFAYRAPVMAPMEEEDAMITSSLSSSLASIGKTTSANGAPPPGKVGLATESSPITSSTAAPRVLDSPEFYADAADKSGGLDAVGSTSPGVKEARNKRGDGRDDLLSGGDPGSGSEAPCFFDRTPMIKLHNCKPAESGSECRQYDVSFSPGVLDAEPPTVTIVVENVSDRTVDVTVDPGHLPHDNPWVSLSSTALQIKPNEKAPLVLTAQAAQVGLHTTYVLFEFGADMVALKTSCEVLAGGRRGAALFDVLVDGQKASGASCAELDLGEVFYDQPVAHRCVDIVNNSNTKLEFNVAHVGGGNIEAHDAAVGVEFSLDMAGRKQERECVRPALHRLAVDARCTQRVFIAYRVTKKVLDVAGGHGTPRAERSIKVAEIVTEVQVKCRWAKDLSKTVLVKVKAVPRAFTVTPASLRIAHGEGLGDTTQPITITNAGSHALSVAVRTAMLHIFSCAFEVRTGGFGAKLLGDAKDTPPRSKRRDSAVTRPRGESVERALSPADRSPFAHHTTLMIPAHGTAVLSLSVSAARIDALAKNHGKAHFAVHEHLFVFNKANPKEREVVPLHCVVGDFDATFSPKNVVQAANPYNELRDQVFLFLRHFKKLSLTDVPREGVRVLSDLDDKREEDGRSLDLDPKSGDESDDSNDAPPHPLNDDAVAAAAHAASLLRGSHEYFLQLRWLVEEILYQKYCGVRGQHLVLAKMLFYALSKNRLITSAGRDADAWREQVAYFNTFRSLFGAEITIDEGRSDRGLGVCA